MNLAWTTEESNFLIENYMRLSNKRLAAAITVLSGVIRTPKAVAGKMSFFHLQRSLEMKRKLNARGACECCLQLRIDGPCSCLFANRSTKFTTRDKHIYYCVIHLKPLWQGRTD